MKKYLSILLSAVLIFCVACFHVAAEGDVSLKPAKTITPVEPFSGWKGQNALVVPVDADDDWAKSITGVTYSCNDSEPVSVRVGLSSKYVTSTSVPYISQSSNGSMSFHNCNAGVFVSGDSTYSAFAVQWGVFDSAGIASGETRDFTFTISADGYEDTVFVQPVTNPKDVLTVSIKKGVKTTFTFDDLQTLWENEGSKEYRYSSYSTFPTFETERFYGPTLNTVLAAANIDVATLADNDIIEFKGTDGYVCKMTIKDLKETRYFFPNGQTTNSFRGTVASQLEDKVEVPYLISLKDGGDGLRNIFGQRDPQEQQKPDWNQKLSTITIYKGTATTYDGLTPTIESGSTVKEGDRLFFDLDKSNWQGTTGSYAFVYYNVSTDGTEPADPTLSDTLYNYKQFESPNYNEEPEAFNYYEFTDAQTTIIKVMTYIRGYAEPVVQTLRYENAGTQEMTCELTSSAGTELKAKKQTTLAAEVKNGTGDYEYKFIVYNKTTNQWYKLRDFGQENTFDWYTGPGGEKTLYVDVKDKTTDEVKRFQLDVNVAESDLAVTSFTSSEGTELLTKAHTTLTAAAKNGTAPYEYKFIVYNKDTHQWYKIRDFKSASTARWYTGPEGSKKLYVDVKDADGTVVRKELAVNVSEAASAQLDNAA